MIKFIIGTLIVVIGVWFFYTPTSAVPKKEWCFYHNFKSLEHYNQTQPPTSLVLIKLVRGQADVYVKCDSFLRSTEPLLKHGPLSS